MTVHDSAARAPRSLRIGVVAPPWLPVPPIGYGGTETVIDTLCRGLRDAGHDVVLYATGDSTCPVELAFAYETAPGIDVGGPPVEVHHVVRAYEHLRGCDIVHDHTTIGPLYALHHHEVPVVTTNHNPFAPPFLTGFQALGGAIPVIAISHHHAAQATGVEIAAVIHHGVDPADFPFGTGSGGYALFLGRMTPGKGAHRAIHAAVAAGMRLLIAGRAQSEAELAYVESQIRPFLGSGVQYLGEIDSSAKVELLSGATCLLNPIAWDEPFGMVMIEALACGTPVVALASGSVPEIVTDGVTGFVPAAENELVDALGRLGEIDRATCRAAVEGHFSAKRMVAEHVALYEQVIEKGERGHHG